MFAWSRSIGQTVHMLIQDGRLRIHCPVMYPPSATMSYVWSQAVYRHPIVAIGKLRLLMLPNPDLWYGMLYNL